MRIPLWCCSHLSPAANAQLQMDVSAAFGVWLHEWMAGCTATHTVMRTTRKESKGKGISRVVFAKAWPDKTKRQKFQTCLFHAKWDSTKWCLLKPLSSLLACYLHASTTISNRVKQAKPPQKSQKNRDWKVAFQMRLLGFCQKVNSSPLVKSSEFRAENVPQ